MSASPDDNLLAELSTDKAWRIGTQRKGADFGCDLLCTSHDSQDAADRTCRRAHSIGPVHVAFIADSQIWFRAALVSIASLLVTNGGHCDVYGAFQFHVFVPERQRLVAQAHLRASNGRLSLSSAIRLHVFDDERRGGQAWRQSETRGAFATPHGHADEAARLRRPGNFARFALPHLMPHDIEYVLYLDVDVYAVHGASQNGTAAHPPLKQAYRTAIHELAAARARALEATAEARQQYPIRQGSTPAPPAALPELNGPLHSALAAVPGDCSADEFASQLIHRQFPPATQGTDGGAGEAHAWARAWAAERLRPWRGSAEGLRRSLCFNAGVLILSLAEWRRMHLTRRLVLLASSRRPAVANVTHLTARRPAPSHALWSEGTQRPMQLLFGGEYVGLPPMLNVQGCGASRIPNSEDLSSGHSVAQDATLHSAEFGKFGALLHFTGRYKPWMGHGLRLEGHSGSGVRPCHFYTGAEHRRHVALAERLLAGDVAPFSAWLSNHQVHAAPARATLRSLRFWLADTIASARSLLSDLTAARRRPLAPATLLTSATRQLPTPEPLAPIASRLRAAAGTPASALHTAFMGAPRLHTSTLHTASILGAPRTNVAACVALEFLCHGNLRAEYEGWSLCLPTSCGLDMEIQSPWQFEARGDPSFVPECARRPGGSEVCCATAIVASRRRCCYSDDVGCELPCEITSPTSRGNSPLELFPSSRAEGAPIASTACLAGHAIVSSSSEPVCLPRSCAKGAARKQRRRSRRHDLSSGAQSASQASITHGQGRSCADALPLHANQTHGSSTSASPDSRCCADAVVQSGRQCCRADDTSCRLPRCAPPEQLCMGGLRALNGTVCLPTRCRTVEAVGCRRRPGGERVCCAETVRSRGLRCCYPTDTSCVMPPRAEDICDGIINGAAHSAGSRYGGDVCCASTCRTCADAAACDTLPGGRAQCCPEAIRRSGRRCDGAHRSACAFTDWRRTMQRANIAWGVYARDCSEVKAVASACIGCQDRATHGLAIVDRFQLSREAKLSPERCNGVQHTVLAAHVLPPARSANATPASDLRLWPKTQALFQLLLRHVPGAMFYLKLDTDTFLNVRRLREDLLSGISWGETAPPDYLGKPLRIFRFHGTKLTHMQGGACMNHCASNCTRASRRSLSLSSLAHACCMRPLSSVPSTVALARIIHVRPGCGQTYSRIGLPRQWELASSVRGRHVPGKPSGTTPTRRRIAISKRTARRPRPTQKTCMLGGAFTKLASGIAHTHA